MNQLLLVRSSLPATTTETEDTLARCVNVREACRILHTRGGIALADRLTHDLDPGDALAISQGLRAFVEAETKPGYFRSYRTLLQEDDADEVVTTALWLKRAARAGCHIWFQLYDDGCGSPRLSDADRADVIRPFPTVLTTGYHGMADEDDNRP
jgi:hypothetical protein